MNEFAERLVERIGRDIRETYLAAKENCDVDKSKEFDGYCMAMRKVLTIINQLLEEEINNKLPETTNYYIERFNRVV